MAHGARGDLDDGDTGLLQAFGVVVGGEVADDDGDAVFASKSPDGFADEGGFAGAGGGEDVDDADVFRFEVAAVAFGLPGVGIEEGDVEFSRVVVWGVFVAVRMRACIAPVDLYAASFAASALFTHGSSYPFEGFQVEFPAFDEGEAGFSAAGA